MRIVSKWSKDGWFYQRHRKEDLFDHDWEHRIRCIEAVTASWAYPTRFIDDGMYIVRGMKKLPQGSSAIRKPRAVQSEQVAAQLKQLHEHGIVHGDIMAKNIFWDGQRAVLIDLEPSLIQRMGQRVCLMGTRPYIHPNDLRQNRLSELTDWLGWQAWAKASSVRRALSILEDEKWSRLRDSLKVCEATALNSILDL